MLKDAPNLLLKTLGFEAINSQLKPTVSMEPRRAVVAVPNTRN